MIEIKKCGDLNYKVYLEKKLIGNILYVVEDKHGWTYKPRGWKEHGDIFETFTQCKKSLD